MKKYLLFVVTALIVTPTVALAQRYLIDLPIDTQGNFEQYINLLYKMSISIAALLAVVKIVIAGAKYMLSDVVTNKSDAKKDIQGALLGLLLILGAVIILNTINPALTDGGLNINKVRVIATNEDRLSPVAAAKQQGEELTAGLPECVTDSSNVSTTGLSKVTTIDVNGCTSAADQLKGLTDFRAACQAKGGRTAVTGGANSGLLRCEVKLAIETFSVGAYQTTSDDCTTSGVTLGLVELGCTDVELDGKYITRSGATVTYDARRFCEEKYPKLGITACMEEVKDAFTKTDDVDGSGFLQNSYCPNNGGRVRSDFVCELPSSTYTLAKARTDSKTAIESKEDYELACKENFGGQIVDTQLSGKFGVDDYLCVKYTN